MLLQALQWNAKITRFNSTVNFVENNQIITASCIQKFSTRVTMNELSTNNGLTHLIPLESLFIPLKTSERQRFFDTCSAYRKRPVAWN